jgi:hypothetical protein
VTLREWHEAFAWVLLLANAAAGAWCLGAHVLPSLRGRALWVGVAVAQILVFVEIAFGVALMQSEHLTADELPDLHVLYGASAIVAVAILYGYRSTSPWVQAREHLVYGLGSLFIMGLAIRELFLV